MLNIKHSDLILRLNEIFQPYYLLITMLLFFGGGAWTLYKLLFSPADIVVSVQNESINYPNTVNLDYIEVYNYIQHSSATKDIKDNAVSVYDYLISAKQQKIYTITNNTNRTIRSINLRETGVKKMTSCAVSSSFLLDDEKNNLLNSIVHEATSGIIYFKDAVNLPPNGDMKIYVWGKFNSYPIDESLTVTYDGGTAKIKYYKSFIGFEVFIAEYYFPILIFIVLTFVVVYFCMVQKYVDNKKTNSNNN